MNMEQLLQRGPYSLDKDEKTEMLTEGLKKLGEHHIENCPEYRRMMDTVNFSPENMKRYEEQPFLPVRLFKELQLKSIRDEEVVKTMTSSGTTGQAVSRIYLDRDTAALQQKVLAKIVSDFTGKSRMPMLIIDCPSVIRNRQMFSARGAGILGFSIFGSRRMYALTDDMELNLEEVQLFLEEHKGEPILLFGFTFMVWKHFYQELVKLYDKTGMKLDLTNGILIHGGGWKKLISEQVSRDDFHRHMKDICGLSRIHDYYGMVEQTGTIYMECEYGHLHASNFSDVLFRNPRDFSLCNKGESGIIQVVSLLPKSYPGHSLLTEDVGRYLGEDDCPCGRKGKYFMVEGRMQKAEIRGCSDTYAAKS
ncbi:LuxE/PaaK family acyltransferase [[Clostridium] hylemonae]|uniref:LuxE/PaaK family acyltransferase n=1 Tax=[Clostridium] hylemonae TaxID=89153 RepID=UPI001FCB2D9D|nr:acyl-protein synthetase [[Clostridium] hylemonae]BDF04157.1 acyl-protein synthetase [[Clostridium] hylemonae]